jgi:hypothetical protein
MMLTNAPPGSGLFVLLALFLTVATIWLLLWAIEARPPIFLGLNHCNYSVCHGDLLRAGHNNL